MTTERAQELQERIAKEAIALLAIHRTAAETATYEQGVTLIGMAWNLPTEGTERWLTLIRQEKETVTNTPPTEQPTHVFPEAELPMNASGMETLDNVWDLFETATRLDSREQREALFSLANELAETQNLLDWIEKTPAERELPEIVAG